MLKFGDTVKILEDFYQGAKGIVLEMKYYNLYSELRDGSEYKYLIQLYVNKKISLKHKVWIRESKLQKINE